MTDERKLIDLQLDNQNEAMTLLGTGDSHLKVLEEELGIAIITRGETITIEGKLPEAETAFEVIRALLGVIRKGINISTRDVIYAVSLAKKGSLEYFQEMYEEEIGKTVKRSSSKMQLYFAAAPIFYASEFLNLSGVQ